MTDDELEETELALAAEQAPRRQRLRPIDPMAGDPPDAVRGAAQAILDPPGDIADDETLRWDPRTVRAPTREGG